MRFGLNTTTNLTERTMHVMQAGTVLVIHTPLIALAAAKDASTMAQSAGSKVKTTGQSLLKDPKGTVYETITAAHDFGRWTRWTRESCE
jgi:hypothetical protein